MRDPDRRGAIIALLLLTLASPGWADDRISSDRDAATAADRHRFESLFTGWVASQRRRAPRAVIAPAEAASGTVSAGERITSGFGMRVNPLLHRTMLHAGADIAAPLGTPVRATAQGVVDRAGWVGGYGLYVEIDHGGGVQTRYGHMSRLNVFARQRVAKGEVIGFVGSTGRSTGNHLHYEIRRDGAAVNPLSYMEQVRMP